MPLANGLPMYARLKFLTFLFDIIFMLFTLDHWIPLSICPTRKHTPYSYLTGWVKIPSSLVIYISCNTPYFCGTLRDIKNFKTKLPIIFRSLTSSISNLFKDTKNPFHFLVLSFSFLYLFNVGTLNILKVLRLMLSVVALLKLLWMVMRCYNSNLLQSIFNSKSQLCNFFIKRKKIDDHYRCSARPHSIQIIPLVWIIATKP